MPEDDDPLFPIHRDCEVLTGLVREHLGAAPRPAGTGATAAASPSGAPATRPTRFTCWKTGVLFSLVHILIARLFMGMMPGMHPLVPEMMPGPGFFMLNLGLIGLLAFVMLHMAYGAIVGAMYGQALHSRAEPAIRRT